MATAQQLLWDVALDQHGFVTTDDARAVGATPHALRLLANRGWLTREAHGVYRFNRFPVSAADDYQQAVLWTGRPEAALSHETALDLLELADVNPNNVHVTVPSGSRVRRKEGANITVHEQDLDSGEIGWWQGVRCVTAATAIRQIIEAGQTQNHLTVQAIETARARGLITQAEREEFLTHLGSGHVN